MLNGNRPFLLTRSGYAGIQRYSAVWTGDNVASDEHMMLGVRLVNSMGLSGVPVTGMNVGGFTGGGSEKLFARWISIGAFSPFFRIHANANTREQEPWSNGEYVESVAKDFVSLRYRFIPYLYSVFYEASSKGLPVSRSLAIQYPFESLIYDAKYENQFLFGPSILVAPGESTRDYYKVFLPGEDWYDLHTGQYYKGREEIVAEAPVDKLPLYVKGGSFIPMQSLVQHLHEQPTDTLALHFFYGSNASNFTYYEDDGLTYRYEQGDYYKREMQYNPVARSIRFMKPTGSRVSKFKRIRFILHGANWNEIVVNGKKASLETGNFSFMPSHGSTPVKTIIFDLTTDELALSW